MTLLKNPQNPLAMKWIVGGSCYTYGENRASATVFFEGGMAVSNTVLMKVNSDCEWIESMEI